MDEDSDDDDEDLEEDDDELDKKDPNYKAPKVKATAAPVVAPAKTAAPVAAKPPTSAKIMIDSKFPEEAGPSVSAGYEEIPAARSGADERGGYKRAVPVEFQAERDDRLMHSLITKYAREVRRDGHNTGHMFLNEDDAKAAVAEVLETHKDNVATKPDFEGTWKHFDVNNDGLVEVERFP